MIIECAMSTRKNKQIFSLVSEAEPGVSPGGCGFLILI